LPRQQNWQKLNKTSLTGGKNADAILTVAFEGAASIRMTKG
jgi:hypothetical protein